MLHRWLLVSVLILGLVVPSFGATSKQYTIPETALKFADSAQSPDAQITLSALPAGQGRVSNRYDRGAGAHSGYYTWRCSFKLTGTNILDAVIELYIATSDGPDPDGQIGTTDVALTAGAKRKNLRPIGVVVVDQTGTDTYMTSSGVFFVPNRYFSLVVWNATTLNFQTSTGAHACFIMPIPFEMQ